MYRSLQDFPPIAAEGFVVVKQIDVSDPTFNFSEISEIPGQTQQVSRSLINRRNRNRYLIFHTYSKLLDFERLMYLVSLVIQYPGIGNLQTTQPSLLANIFGQVPEFTSSLAELTAFMARLYGKIYADEQAIAKDLLWLQQSSLIGMNTIPVPTDNPIVTSTCFSDSADSLVTHPYSHFPAFQRLIQTLRLILHHPFLPDSGQGSLKTLVSKLQQYGIIDHNALDSIRKDIEKVLKPYKILPDFAMRDGYFAGTSILSAMELTQVFQVLQSQAQSLNDPIALEIYQVFAQRMAQSKLLVNSVYPVRAIANRNMIDPKYLPPESLAKNLDRVETAIFEGQLLELNRFVGSGKFPKDEGGFFLVYPLQIVFSNSAWYLGYEIVEGEYHGLFRFERLDRLFMGRLQSKTRSRQKQKKALELLQKLSLGSVGIHLGYSVADQQKFLSPNQKERSQVCSTIELWFDNQIFPFIAEGTKRFPAEQMKMSHPVVGKKSSLPKSIFCLEPSEDKGFPHRFRLVLPKWYLQDVDFFRWVIGFGGSVKVVEPQEFIDKIRETAKAIVQIYSP
jgi:predicted DNA-binding transcriptional regulator YafY